MERELCGGWLVWFQVAWGGLSVNDQGLNEGNDLASDEPSHLRLDRAHLAKGLLFDMAGSWRAP